MTPQIMTNDYLIEQREVVYDGIFRMVRYHLRFRLFAGEMSPPVIREVMERKSAAGVLPYDPQKDAVILIEQFRPGALGSDKKPWLMEVPAGIFMENESPAELAIREAQEEAGCDLIDLIPICEYFVSPGGCNEYFHLFLGRIDASEAQGIHGLAEEHEDIKTRLIPVDDALQLLREGKITTSPAIISLQWLQLNRAMLKQKWQI